MTLPILFDMTGLNGHTRRLEAVDLTLRRVKMPPPSND